MYKSTIVIKTIRAEVPVWSELQRLRVALGVRTMDQVLRHLLSVRRQHLREPAGGAKDSILELKGLGKEVWKGVDPDEYVEALREGW